MVTAAPSKSSISTQNIVDLWASLPDDYSEPNLAANFIPKMLEYLGINLDRIQREANIGARLKPDYLIYNDPSQPPVLVVEIKKRVPELAKAHSANFAAVCQNHPLYKDAVGLSIAPNNGIIQYLDINKVNPNYLAKYGLVFNGDFFQLWRRVDGLVIPVTTIERVNKTSLPKLLKQLAQCLQAPPSALVTAIWNSKGGVAKTTNTINVAACLALAGKRVLLIDLDPQNDLTTGIGFNPKFAPDYFDRVYEKLQLQELDRAKEILTSAIQTKTYSTTDWGKSFELSLLSADREHLNQIADDFSRPHEPREIFNMMLDLIRCEYDYIFIDSSPKRDKLAECLLCNADAILLPIDIGRKSLEHAIHLAQDVIPAIQAMRDRAMRDRANGFTVGPWNLGLLFSNCPNNMGVGIESSIAKVIATKKFTGKQVNTKLNTYAQTKQAEFQGMPVVCWQNSPITKLFHELTKEVFLGHNYTNN